MNNLEKELEEFWRRHLGEEAEPVQEARMVPPPAFNYPNRIQERDLEDLNDLWRRLYPEGAVEPVPAPGMDAPPLATGFPGYFSTPLFSSIPMIHAYPPMMVPTMNFNNHSHLLEKIATLQKQVDETKNMEMELKSLHDQMSFLISETQQKKIEELKKEVAALKLQVKNQENASPEHQEPLDDHQPIVEQQGPSTSTGPVPKPKSDSNGRQVSPFSPKTRFP